MLFYNFVIVIIFNNNSNSNNNNNNNNFLNNNMNLYVPSPKEHSKILPISKIHSFH